MTTPRQPLLGLLTRGWRWWTRELMGLVPGAHGRTAGRHPPGLVVSLNAGTVTLIDERPRSGTRKGAPREGADVWDALAAQARANPKVPVRIRVPYAACYARRVELPEAARSELTRILALDLERTTPFRAKDVLTAHFVDESGSGRGTLAVTQLVLRRDTVAPALAEIQSTGVALSGLDCWDETGTRRLPVDFLPANADEHGPKGGARLVKLLGAAAAVLAVSAAVLSIVRYETALAELTGRVGAAREKAEALRRKIDASSQALAEIEAARRVRARRPPAVETLETMTRLLPDSAWVSSLKIEGDAVDISGEAQSAAPLLAILEDSGDFTDATFTAPVTREAGGWERFTLRARLGKAPKPAATEEEGQAP